MLIAVHQDKRVAQEGITQAKSRIGVAALLLLALAATPLAAHETGSGTLRVEHAWARATAGSATVGAAYLTVFNEGAEMDRLMAAATPLAARAELHAVAIEGGVMTMRLVDAVEVHPGEPVVLRPGGIHIMLIGLRRPLKEGETIPMQLAFERGGVVELRLTVHKAGSMGPDSHGHEMEHHDHQMRSQ